MNGGRSEASAEPLGTPINTSKNELYESFIFIICILDER